MTISIRIDRLTNSIVEVATDRKLDTEVERVTREHIPLLTRKGWRFKWDQERMTRGREVFMLTTSVPAVIHGLISLEDRKDHIYVSLVESADFNLGKGKLYEGVAGNLFAFACKRSFEAGYEGLIAMVPKTQLREHYARTLGARSITGRIMIIDGKEALALTEHYFRKP